MECKGIDTTVDENGAVRDHKCYAPVTTTINWGDGSKTPFCAYHMDSKSKTWAGMLDKYSSLSRIRTFREA